MSNRSTPSFSSRLAAAIWRRVMSYILWPKEKFFGIVRLKPCYHVFSPALNHKSFAVDLGTGHTADFSQALIRQFGMTCVGFEPTLRHYPFLEAIILETQGHFRFIKKAIAGGRGNAVFHEVSGRESGSLAEDHSNLVSYPSIQYEVETVGFSDLFELVERDLIDVMKVDIEGAEYDFFNKAEDHLFNKVGRFVVEFHHHCIDRYNWDDTRNVISRLVRYGFSSHSVDKINYLFYRPSKSPLRRGLT